MLLFGKKLTAREACAQGLVTEVFPDSTFEKEIWTRLKAYAKLPPNVSIWFLLVGMWKSFLKGKMYFRRTHPKKTRHVFSWL